MVVADGTHRRLVAAAGAGHNVAAVEEDARSGQLPAQEADVAVAEELYLKLWHLEEKCGKGAASTKGTSRGRRIKSGTAGMTYRQTRDSQWGRNQKEEVRDVSELMLVHANATLPTGLPA